jgi:hypothetical protein
MQKTRTADATAGQHHVRAERLMHFTIAPIAHAGRAAVLHNYVLHFGLVDQHRAKPNGFVDEIAGTPLSAERATIDASPATCAA